MIQTIEEISMNAWPSLQSIVLDGWILRFANGYTRRANCVMPLYASSQPVLEKIDFCEKMYGDRGRPVIFKMTQACEPPELDTLLARRIYRAEATTSVQLLDLTGQEEHSDPQIRLQSEETEEWQAAFCRMNGIAQAQQATHRQMIHAIVPKKCFAAVTVNEKIIGCGLAVLQSGFVGLFDIVIDPVSRQQNFGERLMRSLLGWGRSSGAHSAYLQVMCNNAPALGLYSKLGFREKYQYWYRVRP
jgi:ribosomal protein S18 acetylase RimI-like enzyme